MGNTNSNNNGSPSTTRWTGSGQESTSKQIQISTDRPDGFYFTGECVNGTVEIPISFLQQHLHSKNNRKLVEFLRQQALGNDIMIDLVGDATYSAEVDAAADSDGHSTHTVNVCRQRCFVTINQDFDESTIQNDNQQTETSFDQSSISTSDTQDSSSSSSTLPTFIKGIFQLHIPDGLPPSLINNRPPSVIYMLELNISSSRYRYQIPIFLSFKGCMPHPTTDIEVNGRTNNQHDVCLQAYLSKTFYRPGEQIPIRISYTNPQQRPIRSIAITLIQFYHIHKDEYRLQLDGKEWVFDTVTGSLQQEWVGQTLLQLPGRPLQASFSNYSVGTTREIGCELDYRIFVELNEKKGDDIHLTLPSIQVTYQT